MSIANCTDSDLEQIWVEGVTGRGEGQGSTFKSAPWQGVK